MRVFCTYCSASKDPAKGLIPAFKRYISPRIVRVQEMAQREASHFCILSGEFGLVDWDQPLPWYDHLLLSEEVPHLAQQVAAQLIERDIAQVDYYTVSPQFDPKVIPYLDTIDKACSSVGVELGVHTLEEPKLSSASRNWKQIMELAAEACYWYKKRFRIETFFSDQKSRGFNLHKSHLSDHKRIFRLMFAACLAYIWIVFLGALAMQDGLNKIIHRPDRCDISLFQMGLRALEFFLDHGKPIPVAFRMLS